MARLVGSIPNFINGISQQPDQIRLPSQAETQVNAFSTVAKGLIKRPPTESVAKISASQTDTAFTHIINRGVNERFIVVYDTGHSDTAVNKLTTNEASFVEGAGEWVATSMTATTTRSHTAADPSYDGTSDHLELSGNASDIAYVYPDFTPAATTWYTFSFWARLVSGEATITATIQGTDFAAPTIENKELTSSWQKFDVSGQTTGAPVGGGTSAFEIKITMTGTTVMDVAAAQLEVGQAATVTQTPNQSVMPKLKIYDFAGVEQQVWIPQGESYLAGVDNDPKTDLRALTVADYTFVVDKTRVVAKGGSTSATQNPIALVSVGTVQPGSTVKVFVDGVQRASQAVSDTDPSELETNWMAAALETQLDANLPAGFTANLTQTEGSVIYIENTSGTDFEVEVRDGSNGLGIKVIKDKVQYFEDLPREGKEGFTVEVAGDPVTGFGNYWVKFETDTIPVWAETVEPGIDIDLSATSMPHQLTYEASNTFRWDTVSWSNRAVGDDQSNPFPTFIGHTINDVFFTEGRLAFLSAEGVIMSEAGQFFNFFRSTVTTLVDGDVIDVGTNHTKVSVLRHAVPYQEQLLLFSDQTQFRLTKGDVLSPASVGIQPITEFESSIRARPAPVGNFVFFGVEKSDFASLREYFVADDSLRNDAREITGHVPEYIPSGISRIVGTSNEDALVIQSDGSTTAELYIYKYFWSGREKVQSSWSKWTFPDVTTILGYDFIQSTIYMVNKRADGTFLEKLELDTGAQDDSGLGYNLSLDRKIFSSDSRVSSNYDAGSDETTFTFSDMTWKSVPKIMGCNGNSATYPEGYYVDIVGSPTTYDANTIVVSGDATSDDFVFGIPYTTEYVLSDIVVKDSDGRSSVPITEGRLQIFWITFNYADTGYFEIEVDNIGRAANTYIFNGRTLGSLENPVGTLPIDQSGTYRVPVFTRNDRAGIKISSDDALPMRILSADWIGNLFIRHKRA